MLPIAPRWTEIVRRHALVLLDPPWCYAPSASPRVDVALLRVQAARGGIVLTDIPDDWDSLEEALAVPGVVGAIAVACDGIDLWVGPEQEVDVDVPLRRTTETVLARFELRELADAEVVLAALGRVRSTRTG